MSVWPHVVRETHTTARELCVLRLFSDKFPLFSPLIVCLGVYYVWMWGKLDTAAPRALQVAVKKTSLPLITIPTAGQKSLSAASSARINMYKRDQ